MKLFSMIQKYADQIGGQFTDYDHTKAIIVVPLKDERFQTVVAVAAQSKYSSQERLVFSSKVSEFSPTINLKELLEQTAEFDYSKFMIEDNYLKVEASCLAEAATENEIKQMIQEVAVLADEYEKKITGKDIH